MNIKFISEMSPCANIGFLFDLDGVLIDSESEYTKIWNKVNSVYPALDGQIAYKIKGMTLSNILERHYPDKNIQGKVKEMLWQLEEEMSYRWLPGAKEFILWLKNNDLPRALVTSSDNKKMNHLREELPELESLFTEIVTANRISKSKPDPEGYLLAAGLLGVKPEHCAVFEDSLQGVKAGKNSGAYVIGVAGTLPAETLSPYSDLIVTSLDDIDKKKLCEILYK